MKKVIEDLQAMYRFEFSKCGWGGDPGKEFVEFWRNDFGLGQIDFLDQLGEGLVGAFLSGLEDADFFSWAVNNLYAAWCESDAKTAPAEFDRIYLALDDVDWANDPDASLRKVMMDLGYA
ncbi:hypothetical protein [Qipengyuania psychrotolerans]|uniref:Uncharacterized protein n=1 Tax=Qipengyuania psychrotolerans TaxID=2867238 RepID=A0ABX8ZBZ6_9SPHN|nr:hypothetical protein [Qipengyuania psychrotolerans]QZD86526.1 hypothetical protein K3166_09865 [Qipengyuania psychrotolerans]